MSDEIIGKLHRACTQIRLAIAVYEKEVPEGESTAERLATAMQILTEVRGGLPAVSLLGTDPPLGMSV